MTSKTRRNFVLISLTREKSHHITVDARLAGRSARFIVDTGAGGTGSFGYMLGTNCDQPMFKFSHARNRNDSNVPDVHYELKFWHAAP